jgi:hypothetical protein
MLDGLAGSGAAVVSDVHAIDAGLTRHIARHGMDEDK